MDQCKKKQKRMKQGQRKKNQIKSRKKKMR